MNEYKVIAWYEHVAKPFLEKHRKPITLVSSALWPSLRT